MTLNVLDLKVLVRGGGEMASGIAHRLHCCHMNVLITEVSIPTTIRRPVAFAEAVFQGYHQVEGVKSVRVHSAGDAYGVWETGGIPLFVDEEAKIREALNPTVIVDAIMAKKNTGTDKSHAPIVVGVGPGFTAGESVHVVVESNRGHNLGRVLWQGKAEENTGIPAPVGGYTDKRVLRAPQSGNFKSLQNFGELVAPGDVVAQVDGLPIKAQVKGVLRGILKDGIQVGEGMKVGDIDPRGEREYCYLISDKARAIAGGVLEAVLSLLKDLTNDTNKRLM